MPKNGKENRNVQSLFSDETFFRWDLNDVVVDPASDEMGGGWVCSEFGADKFSVFNLKSAGFCNFNLE